MDKFYFTFGREGQIYNGGWVEIIAENLAEAKQKFIKRFGDQAIKDGFLRYAFDYPEEQFKETGMLHSGNFGVFCHEVIQ